LTQEDGEVPDPRVELAELAAAVRAYVEWQVETGAAGLPVEASPSAVLTALGAGPPASAPARAPAAGAPVARPQAARGPVEAPAFAAPAWSAPPVTSAAPPAAAHPPAPPAPPVAAAPVAAAPVTAPAAAPRAAEASPDERRTRLALLAEEVRSCTRCVLHQTRRKTVFSRGDPFAELIFVGEGPGGEEDVQGLPFVGPAGQLLDRMIAAMGYQRDEVYIANIVKCRPPNNRKPEPDEMASCMPYLVEQLGLVKPKVIVALGATAVQGMCGTTTGITRLRGTWKSYKGAIPIMPTFHPAYLLRNPAAKREVWADLQEVMKLLGKAPPPPPGRS
jgi:uracil-DNA glycosylase family 4